MQPLDQQLAKHHSVSVKPLAARRLEENSQFDTQKANWSDWCLQRRPQMSAPRERGSWGVCASHFCWYESRWERRAEKKVTRTDTVEIAAALRKIMEVLSVCWKCKWKKYNWITNVNIFGIIRLSLILYLQLKSGSMFYLISCFHSGHIVCFLSLFARSENSYTQYMSPASQSTVSV